MESAHEIGVFLNESELLQLLSLARSLATCDDRQQFLECLRSARGILFYDRATAVLGMVGSGGRVQGAAPLNLDYPQEFVDSYLREELWGEDPFFREVVSTGRPCFWKEAAQRTPPGPRLSRLLDDFRISAGCSHGLFPRHGGKASYFSFEAGWMTGVDPRFDSLITYLGPFLHGALCRVHRLDGPAEETRALSSREIETLRWVRAGKNTCETSRILGVSQNTVKFHLKNAMGKLGAANRSHAVALAIGKGLLGD